MNPSIQLRTAFLIGILVFTGGCLLQSQGNLQTLVLYFELEQAIPRGAPFEAHIAIYPAEVKVKGQQVRISGRLDPAPSASKITVQAIGEDPASGRQLHKFSAVVKVDADGSFSVIKKFNKNISAGTIQRITIEPTDGAIEVGTEIGICVDVTKRKSDFTAATSCATSGAGGDPTTSGDAVVVEIQDNAFVPKRVTIQPGQTVRWRLTGTDPAHTVTAMTGSFDSGFAFGTTGAFFERTFTAAEDGQTFEYSCTTHKGCCEMQGSVLVGANASPPQDGY